MPVPLITLPRLGLFFLDPKVIEDVRVSVFRVVSSSLSNVFPFAWLRAPTISRPLSFPSAFEAFLVLGCNVVSLLLLLVRVQWLPRSLTMVCRCHTSFSAQHDFCPQRCVVDKCASMHPGVPFKVFGKQCFQRCHPDVLIVRKLCSSVLASGATPAGPLLELFNIVSQVLTSPPSWTQKFTKQSPRLSRRSVVAAAIESSLRFKSSSLCCLDHKVDCFVECEYHQRRVDLKVDVSIVSPSAALQVDRSSAFRSSIAILIRLHVANSASLDVRRFPKPFGSVNC